MRLPLISDNLSTSSPDISCLFPNKYVSEHPLQNSQRRSSSSNSPVLETLKSESHNNSCSKPTIFNNKKPAAILPKPDTKPKSVLQSKPSIQPKPFMQSRPEILPKPNGFKSLVKRVETDVFKSLNSNSPPVPKLPIMDMSKVSYY